MPGKSIVAVDAINSIVNVLREVDVRPVRRAAESPFVLAFFSRDLPLAQHLVDLLYRGLREHDIPPARVCGAFPLGAINQPQRMQIAVVVAREDAGNAAEQQLAQELERAGVRVLVALVADAAMPPHLRHQWLPASVVTLPCGALGTLDDALASRSLVSSILGLKAVNELALARHLPAFRSTVSRSLIDETALANAVYSFGTGIAEIYPLADIPLNVADMMVLTKNQALMSYKIALAMGLTADFRQVMPQLAAVVGGAFLFRQAARGLIGLVPGFGLVPKVGVAFAGTYATGEAIHRWCAYGERVTGRALREMYDSAVVRGKTVARSLLGRYRKDRRTDIAAE